MKFWGLGKWGFGIRFWMLPGTYQQRSVIRGQNTRYSECWGYDMAQDPYKFVVKDHADRQVRHIFFRALTMLS